MRALSILLALTALGSGCRLRDYDGDGFLNRDDCEIFDPTAYEGAPEICDGIDNDCDGEIDEDVLVTFYADADADGFGDENAAQVQGCEAPSGYSARTQDCDDRDAGTNPLANEVCDGADNDCDGSIDEEGALGLRVVFVDADGDGFGTTENPIEACTPPLGYADNDRDCNDANSLVHPMATEVCDGIDNDCKNGADGADAQGAKQWYLDGDGDSYGRSTNSVKACTAPNGYVANSTDCDDGTAAASPAGTEVCDGLDNDCDGHTDDAEAIDRPTWYADSDGDGSGDPDTTLASCAQPQHYVADADDCDDSDGTVYPGAWEPCGGPDRDCDGQTPAACASCLDWLENGEPDGDGLYEVDLDGSAGPLPPMDVYCDMTTDGGGWTLAQRTRWSWTETGPLLTGYDDWFDLTLGDPAPGKGFRLAGKAWPFLDVEKEHLVVHALRTTAGGACAPLYYKGTNGTITATATTATITGLNASVNLTNATELSTLDTGPSTCPTSRQTVPWFLSSCCSTCFSVKGSMWTDAPHPAFNYSSSLDLYGRRKPDVCAGLTPKQADDGTNFYGVDTMEYYIR